MASWEQKTLAESGIVDNITNTAAAAAETVTDLATQVQTIAEAAKVFLGAIQDPIGQAIQAAAQPLLNTLNDYRNLGYYYLLVDPRELNSSSQNNYGLEMITDTNGRVIFKPSTVVDPDSPFVGQTTRVNDAYRSSLKLDDLPATYRDRRGRSKSDAGFTPPIPRLVNPPKLVLGGYDPATWTGEAEEVDPLPQLPAPDCLQIMADAFDDKGDVPKFRVINPAETFDKGPFTVEGSAVSNFDATANLAFHLYRNANTQLSTSERGQITKQIRAGKPNYAGSSVNVSALAVLVAATDPQDFIDSLKNMAEFFGSAGAFPSFQNVIDAYNDLITPDNVIVRIDVNTKYGVFGVDEFIKGRTSGAVGQVVKITEVGPTVKTRKDTKVVTDDFGDVIDLVTVEINLNPEEVWKTYEIEYTPKFDLTNRFVPNEQIMEAEPYERQNTTSAVPTVYYRIKGEELSGANYAGSMTYDDDGEELGTGYSDADLPKYGICLGVDAIAPNSVAPDFQSVTAAQIIPGWSDFFDGLIELANGLIGLAVSSIAFLDTLIEAIDDLTTFLTGILAKINAFLELLQKGLPNAGIYLLPMKTNGGNDALKSAITGSTGAPDARYKYSMGLLLVSVEVGGIDPLEQLGGLLGLSFQSV